MPYSKGGGLYRSPAAGCAFGNCLAFDGVNDNVQWGAGSLAPFQFGTADFQVEFWVNSALNAFQAAFSIGNINTGAAGLVIGPVNTLGTDPAIQAYYRAGGVLRFIVSNSLSTTWRHVVFQKRTAGAFTELTLYDDGTKEVLLLDSAGGNTPIADTVPFDPATQQLVYGSMYSGGGTLQFFLTGQLDDVRAGTYLYTDAEVLQAMAAKQCPISQTYYNQLVHRCRLDSVNPQTTAADDVAALTGTLTNFTGSPWQPH